VAIVEDKHRTREGLRALIDGSEGLICVGAWGSMEEAFASEWIPPLHIMLVDLGLPGMSGIEGSR
jgi:DNA-binding NarL/FixJ family response regulator